MTHAGPLQWLTGAGWLVLVGGGAWQGEEGEIDDRILARADFARPVAFLPTAGGSLAAGEALLDLYAGLGGPRGAVLPILQPTDAWDDENRRLLAEAGVIFLGDGDGLALARTLQDTPALAAMAQAFTDGALIVGLGAAAAVLGEWIAAMEPEPGWGWVRGVIAPSFVSSVQYPYLQAALRSRPGLLGLGIPQRTALALGPQGEVETWGLGEVTVVVPR